MELKFDKTNRGFDLIKFKDIYGAECSIQKSSLANQDTIWFGADDRMHLNQEQVKELLIILQQFVNTGEIKM